MWLQKSAYLCNLLNLVIIEPRGEPEFNKEDEDMALKNLAAWNGNVAIAACGAACGASDKPAEPKPAACGAACGAADK